MMMESPLENDDLTPAGSRSARASSQREPAAPLLLYPISVNNALSSSAIFNNKDNKVLHGVGGSEAVSSSSEFTHGAIVLLIEAMQRCWDVYSARERSLLFQSVQKELEGHGHSLPVEKIRRKWNNLIVTYKRVKDRSLLCGGQTKTSWEYFEMMDNILGKTNIVQRGPASATLVGFATTAKAAVKSEDPPSSSVPVVAPRLLPTGIISTSSPIPTLVPVRCQVSTDSARPKPVIRPALRRSRLRQLRLGSALQHGGGLAPAQLRLGSGPAEERTELLRCFLRSQEERARSDEQLQRRTDARERRRERAARAEADAMTRMATALELISSKQDTIIALLQRLADKH
ncbi:uncharacterized protein si:ch1073-357b18.4 [Pimephales promelas]|uniref:uncharacterized protein si:ch1073-357b18.4 n=1 Tax=Pimephales promelas TaxID=90988 RepID=UPI001955EA50|nr:uncharacterized protein si:ch1073-357b18.4 [Pimephales promelas]KAG1935624.1 hypothetical protein F2P79_019165 [Pimephales promelas]